MRTLHDISVGIEGLSRTLDVEDKIHTAISDIPDCDLVSIRLTGGRELDFKPDFSAIEDRFKRRFFHFDLKDETRLIISAESFRYDKSLKGECIRLVLADASLSEDERGKIIEFGIRALMGESPDDDTV